MIFEQYLKNLNQLAIDRPELLKHVVVSASDDEGNSFSEVWYTPSIGRFIPADKEFNQEENFDELDEEDRITNAICIN